MIPVPLSITTGWFSTADMLYRSPSLPLRLVFHAQIDLMAVQGPWMVLGKTTPPTCSWFSQSRNAPIVDGFTLVLCHGLLYRDASHDV